MDDALKETLIEQFRAYLDDPSQGGEPAPTFQESDEFSLLAELAGLKSEVKRESRQMKEARDQFSSALGTLQSGYEVLSREFEQRQQAEKDAEQQRRREVLRPLLLQLLELHDRLEAGVKFELTPRRSFLARWRRNEELMQLIESLRTGQHITLRRLNQILSEYHLRPLEVLDKPLDPHTMKVVEVESRADVAQGIVLDELRKGFFWGEELLRPAEVKVAKRDDTKRKETTGQK
jgi:molecular chaperone GrpE